MRWGRPVRATSAMEARPRAVLRDKGFPHRKERKVAARLPAMGCPHHGEAQIDKFENRFVGLNRSAGLRIESDMTKEVVGVHKNEDSQNVCDKSDLRWKPERKEGGPYGQGNPCLFNGHGQTPMPAEKLPQSIIPILIPLPRFFPESDMTGKNPRPFKSPAHMWDRGHRRSLWMPEQTQPRAIRGKRNRSPISPYDPHPPSSISPPKGLTGASTSAPTAIGNFHLPKHPKNHHRRNKPPRCA